MPPVVARSRVEHVQNLGSRSCVSLGRGMYGRYFFEAVINLIHKPCKPVMYPAFKWDGKGIGHLRQLMPCCFYQCNVVMSSLEELYSHWTKVGHTVKKCCMFRSRVATKVK